MHIKIHDSYRKLAAISDKDLLGKSFEEGNRVIEVRPGFFEGELKTKDEMVEIIRDLNREDATFNIVGEKSIEVALEAGVINEGGVMKIQGVPVALVLL